MSISQLLQETLDCGIFLYVENGGLKFRKKREAEFSDSLKDRIQAMKPEIIAYLQQQSSALPQDV